jgi:purine-binding chemotaxis protein CheW
VAAAGNVHPDSGRQIIVFSLHDEQYGLPIGSVREIIRYTPPRVTATAHGLIRGMINLRGQVLPVLDLSSRLGYTVEVSDATRILIIDVSNGVLGLIVDTVDGVVQVAVDRIEPIPGAVAADALGIEIAAIDDRLVMLMDPDRALGHVLPGAPGGRAAEPVTRARATEPPRAPRPSAPPAARRRSAATPQIPRSRRRPQHPGGRGE